MRPLRDPAPSRLAYRLQRLMLTPGVKTALRFGLPSATLALFVAVWVSDEGNRQTVTDSVSQVRRQIEERPEFMVRLMSVETPSDHVADNIRTLLHLDLPTSSFDLDLAAMQSAVETLDAVAGADVHIRSGGVLEIVVDERIPAVVWRTGEGLTLLDAAGHKVATLDARLERADLPLIAGEGADARISEALKLIAAAQPISGRLRGLVRIGERRWDVALDRGQRIMLPETDARIALERVIAMDAAQDLLARDVSAIDFRNPARPVLRLSETAMETLHETGWAK